MDAYKTKPAFLAVDFYCGAGGTTRGMIDAGGYVIAGIDKDLSCEATYRGNNPNKTLDKQEPSFIAKDMFPRTDEYPSGQQQEILDELSALIEKYRLENPELPLMFAICAPCQSFTKFVQPNITGRRKASRERDQNLLAQTIPFIEHFRPDMILSENVAGISRGRYRHVWERFQADLTELGYHVGTGEVDAAKFGVPQHRRRSIILAVTAHEAHGEGLTLDVPPEDVSVPVKTVRETIGSLPPIDAGQAHDGLPDHRCRNLRDINVRRLNAVRPGEPNYAFPEELRLDCHRRLDAKGKRGFGDVYTRMHPDRPAPTITTRFHSISNGRFGHYDTEQPRGLSLMEGALLQSFPPEYHFEGSGMDAIARMIGNAVPPKLSEFMARHLTKLCETGVAS